MKVYLEGMGNVFSSVVGLTTIGFIDMLLGSAANLGLGYFAMVVMLVAIIVLVTMLSGSGNASFFSFSNLAPEVAAQVGTTAANVAMPMQLAAGLMRSASRVAGVVIACAGVANVPPIELAKRTMIPMLGGLLSVLVCSQILI